MDRNDDALQRQLRDALPTVMATDVRTRHLNAIRQQLPRRRAYLPFRLTRRTAVVFAAAAFAILPAGTVFAAQNALPGDALYSVKLAGESVHRLLDPDVTARHRLDELEALLERAEVRRSANPTDADDTPGLEAAHQRAAEQINRTTGELSERFHRLTDRLHTHTAGSGGSELSPPLGRLPFHRDNAPSGQPPADTGNRPNSADRQIPSAPSPAPQVGESEQPRTESVPPVADELEALLDELPGIADEVPRNGAQHVLP